MARDFIQWNNSAYGWNHQLASDTIQIGSVRTRSSSSYVTDSSAAATAYSCAIKTYNGAVAIDENGNPCGTVLEAAKLAGYKTGLVVTSHATDATPAAFASHIWNRNQEDKIAVQLIGDQPMGRVTDILFGGGLVYFQPNSTPGSARPDSRDLIYESQAAGVHTLSNRTAFDALAGGENGKLPMLGLFAPRALAYEIDRGTADHECGGLTLGGIVDTGDPQFNPAPLADAKHSAGYIATAWAEYNGSDPDSRLTELFAEYGIYDANRRT
ncbi:hypothetical protein FRC10_009930 [Ceratobasidium sp. 414]|nr:hypothetical protein FRC10_009930 [Ceratobasidium sp. 414]